MSPPHAKKYKNLLTENEYKTLTQKTYQISNFYMLPKLHKSKELNDIIMATIVNISMSIKF